MIAPRSSPKELLQRKEDIMKEILPKDLESRLRNKEAKALIRNKISLIADDIIGAELKLEEIGNKYPASSKGHDAAKIFTSIIRGFIDNLIHAASKDMDNIINAVRIVRGNDASKAAVENGFGIQRKPDDLVYTTINDHTNRLNLAVRDADKAIKSALQAETEEQKETKLESKEKPKVKVSAIAKAALADAKAPLEKDLGSGLDKTPDRVAGFALAAAERKAAMDAKRAQDEAKKAQQKGQADAPQLRKLSNS